MNHLLLLISIASATTTIKHRHNHHHHHPSSTSIVSRQSPIHMLVPLPELAGDSVKNPYRLTLAQARPVFDIALDDVYHDRQLIAAGSLQLHYRDTQLSDSIGPNLAVAMLCAGTLDVIVGFAYVYALAPVARMSATWTRTIRIDGTDRVHEAVGVPVLTTVGQVRTLSSRQEYRLLTRMSGTYTVLSAMVRRLFIANRWLNHAYIFHDKTAGGSTSDDADGGGFGDCFFQMDAIKQQLQTLRPLVHNYFIFDEKNGEQRAKVRQYLIDMSMISNGELYNYI